jgi:hypothetical protein
MIPAFWPSDAHPSATAGYEALVINPDGSKRRTKRFPIVTPDTAQESSRRAS